MRHSSCTFHKLLLLKGAVCQSKVKYLETVEGELGVRRKWNQQLYLFTLQFLPPCFSGLSAWRAHCCFSGVYCCNVTFESSPFQSNGGLHPLRRPLVTWASSAAAAVTRPPPPGRTAPSGHTHSGRFQPGGRCWCALWTHTLANTWLNWDEMGGGGTERKTWKTTHRN